MDKCSQKVKLETLLPLQNVLSKCINNNMETSLSSSILFTLYALPS